MSENKLTSVIYNDFTGITRARSFPSKDLAKRLHSGLGWVPANMCITPFGPIAEVNPFGPIGDLRLRPDPETETVVPLGADASDLHLLIGSLYEPDGSPWVCCARNFLKDSLETLSTEFGLRLKASFEHEFVLQGFDFSDQPSGFTFSSARVAESFLERLTEMLLAAGIEPEMVIPEYGAQQFEVTYRPACPLVAADRAVLTRELTREAARLSGCHAYFSPKVTTDGPGNGVHLHFSLENLEGSAVTTAAVVSGKPAVDSKTGSFVAGIIRSLPAITLPIAPAGVSYLRLSPHQWSAAYTSFGHCNREAALRLCPSASLQEAENVSAANVELRVPDAAASPHLALALAIQAGMAGLRDGMVTPPLLEVDPSTLSGKARKEAGINALPQNLEEAISFFEKGIAERPLMPKLISDVFLALKKAEFKMVRNLTDEELCGKYSEVY